MINQSCVGDFFFPIDCSVLVPLEKFLIINMWKPAAEIVHYLG